MQSAILLLDSINPWGNRLTSFLLFTMSVRQLIDERTHRSLSWSAASSRTKGVDERIDQCLTDPLSPAWGERWYGPPEKGSMGRGPELSDSDSADCDEIWRESAANAVETARKLLAKGVHWELATAALQPYMRYSAVVTATNWDGFWAQRAVADDCSHGPRREVRLQALEMKRLYEASTPKLLLPGEWHLPFADKVEGDLFYRKELCISMCARATIGKAGEGDEKLAGWLLRQDPPHLGPFEHACQCVEGKWANLEGWRSERNLRGY